MKDIIILNQVDSTNDYAKEHYMKLESETVIVAHEQIKGRGRSNHIWNSPTGNLYMTILFKNIKRNSIFNYLMNTSISIVRLLDNYNIDASIKYPNDIIVKNKKIAGILMETKGDEILDYLIIGIGININQLDFKELREKATSIYIEKHKEYNTIGVMKDFISILEVQKELYKEYIMKSYVLGKRIHYSNESFIVTGINKDGKLLLKGSCELEIHMNEISLEELYE